jgi:hypothetical protein
MEHAMKGAGIVSSLEVGDRFFAYMGECFMYGLMDGEILDMMGESPRSKAPSPLEGMDREFRKVYVC